MQRTVEEKLGFFRVEIGDFVDLGKNNLVQASTLRRNQVHSQGILEESFQHKQIARNKF